MRVVCVMQAAIVDYPVQCLYIDPLHVTSFDAINFLSAMLEDKQTVT